MSRPFTSTDIEEIIKGAIELYIDGMDYSSVERERAIGNMVVNTYEDEGLLTSDKGLVIKVGDSKFQMAIVEVRQCKNL